MGGWVDGWIEDRKVGGRMGGIAGETVQRDGVGERSRGVKEKDAGRPPPRECSGWP